MPVKVGGRALEGEPQRGSGLEWVWWWSPSSGIQTPPKNCHGGNLNSPTKEGREFRPNVHEGHNGNTSADDKRPRSQFTMLHDGFESDEP